MSLNSTEMRIDLRASAKYRGRELWLKSTSLIVSALHQDEGGIGKSIPNGRKISQDPRNLEGGGDGFPNTSRDLVEYGHSLSINFSTGSGSGNPSLWAGKD